MRTVNLTVLTGAQARKLRFEGKRAIGVELRHDGAETEVRARREVILAAGAVGSPQLLQVSGVGPGPLLQQFGIPVRHALPGVGENLQDHLQIRTAFKVSNARTMNERANSLLGRASTGALSGARTRR